MKKSMRTKIRILEDIVMIVVKHGPETCALRNTEEDFLDVF
jgi:hypothetical protein